MTIARSPHVDAARDLFPLLDEHGGYGDEHGTLHPEVIEALQPFFRMWAPTEVGGMELDPVTSLEVIEALTYADASSGWIAFAAALGSGTAAAYLPEPGAAELYGDGRFAVLAGQGTKPGIAVPATGGYTVSGDWNFASGVQHATHINTLCLVEDTHMGVLVVVPLDDVTVIENWDVMGLRGTGSHDYRIAGALVSENYCYPGVIEEPRRGGALFRLGVMGIAMLGHSGWAIGVGRRLLDELAAATRAKAGRAGSQAESDSFHEQYAEAEMRLRSARAVLHEAWQDTTDTVYKRGDLLTTRQKTLTRLALANATWSAHAVGLFAYKAAGTTALRAGTMQRFFRDLHAGTQHILSGPGVIRHAGRELAGLAEGEQWVFHELMRF